MEAFKTMIGELNGIVRITSYNVCYTKLLRYSKALPKVPLLSAVGTRCGGMPRRRIARPASNLRK